MATTKPATVICIYRIAPGKEGAFRELLARHWPTLRKLGLVTEEPSRVYRGEDAPGRTFFVEIFTWVRGDAPDTAERTPEVMAIWEPMGKLCEARLGRPAMEFPHVEAVPLRFARV